MIRVKDHIDVFPIIYSKVHPMTQITDADLVDKLEAARGTDGFALVEKQLATLQRKRDRDRAAQAEQEAAEQARNAQLDLLTPLERRREAIRYVIDNEGPAPQHLQYMHSSLAICGLPYKRLPDGIWEFERRQGRMGVVIEAGKLRNPNGDRVQQPVPYGSKPRLILSYLSSIAIRERSATIDVGRSFSGFLKELGFDARGGERGNIGPFKEQLQALAACRMQISTWNGSKSATLNTSPFQSIELWLTGDGDKGIWPSTLTFSEDFFKSLQKHALPMDSRALVAFSNSPRKLDVMFWLTYRLHSIKEPRLFPWTALQSQFGDGFTRLVDFRKAFIRDLAHIGDVFPRLRYSFTPKGMMLEDTGPNVLAIPDMPRAKSLK